MAVKPLNAIGGFSVGETLIGVISPNGNVTAANLTVTGNSNLGLLSNVTITGGTSGYVLSTDGTGNLSWIESVSSPSLTVSQYTTGSYSNTVPNVSNLLFDTTTGFNVQDLGSGNVLVSLGSTFKTWEVNGQSSLVAVGEDTVEFVAGNGIIITTNALSTPQQIEFTADFSNIIANTANTVTDNAQPNITSVGTLTTLVVSGDSSFTGANISLGNVSNLHITGGISGQVLTTNGSGNLVWATGSGGGTSGILLPVSTVDDFTGNGVQTVFDLSVSPSNINLTTVNYNGATLVRNSYTVVGSTITFSAPPAANSIIEVTTLTNGSTMANGNSNISVPEVDGNVIITVDSNIIAVASNTGVNVNGTFDSTGNISAPYYIGNGSQLTGISAGNITGPVDSAYTVVNNDQPNITSVGTLANLTVTGNVSGNYFIGNGSQLTGIDATSIQNGNSNVKTYANSNVTTSVAGVSNVLVVTSVGANVAGTFDSTGNISAPFFIGNGSQLSGIDATSIQNGNSNVKTYANSNVTTSVSGNANVFVITGVGANVAGTFDSTGNISAPYFIGNGSQLTGIDATSIQNGNSNVKVYANGNVTTSVNGTSNVLVITDTGANVDGTLNVTGNVNLIGANVSLGDVSNLHITGGSANFALRTDGAGNLTWASAGSALVMTTDAFTGDGSNSSFTLTAAPLTKFYTLVSLGGLFQPASTYSLSNNVVTFSSIPPVTAPIEVVTFGGGTAPSATTYVYAEITANTAAELNTKYIVNTDTTSITITLPNNPILGSEIGILDGTGNASLHNITIARNGNKIQGIASDMTVSTNRAAFTLVYYNASQGWILTNI